MKIASWLVAIVGTAALLAAGAGCSSGSGTGDEDEGGVTPGTPFSNDSGLKETGDEGDPPFLVDPENPAPGEEVTIVISIDGATAIAFTASGYGCGTVASTSGDNPLTVIGTTSERGDCDMTAVATGVDQTYEGRFEVEATDPNIPPIGLADSDWADGAPEPDDEGPVITAVDGPSSIANGGSGTYTITFDSNNGGTDVEVDGVLLVVSGYPYGFFYAAGEGASGAATFTVEAAWNAAAGSYSGSLYIVDSLDRLSAAFPVAFAVSDSMSADLAASIAPTGLSVSGKVTYEKFIVSEKGRSKTGTMVPVRSATIKAVSMNRSGTVLGQSTTGKDGTYKIEFGNNTGEPRYFVQVFTSNDGMGQSVKNKAGTVYSFKGSELNSNETANETDQNLEIKEADSSGAFNIWDVVVKASLYTKINAGVAPQRLSVYWNRLGKTGSFYSPNNGNPQIWMKGASDDPDEWDDTVIGHEYGHFVMGTLSQDDSPGDDHDIDTPTKPTEALSEGWATFFAGATLDTSMYIDTNGSGGIYASYSFETPPSSVPRGTVRSALDGNLSEVLPNAVLWDLFDTTNETKDTLQNHSEAIWKVMTTYLQQGSTKFVDRGYEGRDLVDFLDGWICLGYGNIGSTDSEGLKGAAIGLMQLPSDFIKADIASCR